jgi:hypothetical protein
MTKQQLLDRIVEVVDVTRRRLTTGPNMRALLSDMVNEMYPTAGQVKFVKVEITADQIKSAWTNPVKFGITPPPGRFILPLQLWAKYTYNGVAFIGETTFAVRQGSSLPFALAISALGFTATTRTSSLLRDGFDLGANRWAAGEDCEFYALNSDPATGTGAVTLYMTYLEVEE